MTDKPDWRKLRDEEEEERREEVQKRREERNAEERQKKDWLRKKLEVEFGVIGNPKADKLWELAWDYGHSSGPQEVESYYIELVELIK